MKRRTVVFGVLLMVFLLPVWASAASFRAVVAFGDSLTDNGFADGHGFKVYTNGKVWVEYLAPMLDCVYLEDRAWGGAKTGQGHWKVDWSGFHWQLDHYLPDDALSDVLFTVWIGINDFYDGKGDHVAAVDNTVQGIERLIRKGARNILVLNLPDLTLAPAFQSEGDYESAAANVRQKVKEFNEKLHAVLFDEKEGLETRNPQVQFYFLDAYSLFNELADGDTFKNVTDAWMGTYEYPHSDGYMWWDDWHPMTEVHRRLADAAYSVLDENCTE